MALDKIIEDESSNDLFKLPKKLSNTKDDIETDD